MHEGMILVRSPSPTTFATDLGEPGPAQQAETMKRNPTPSPVSRPVWTGRERYSSTSGKECSRELRHPLDPIILVLVMQRGGADHPALLMEGGPSKCC
jgi:hypothetical protein